MSLEKPFLATDAPELEELPWPMMGLVKYEGTRVMIRGHKAYTRQGKPFHNPYIATTLHELGLPDLDAEVMIPGVPFTEANGICRRQTPEPVDFHIRVFDTPTHGDRAFRDRMIYLQDRIHWHLFSAPSKVQMASWKPLYNVQEALDMYGECLAQGYEGLVLRDGPYKHGRCGKKAYKKTKQPLFYRLKPSKEQCVTVEDVLPMLHNDNPLEQNEFGGAKRSHAKAGLVARETLGTLVCRDEEGQRVRVGNSVAGCSEPWTDAERERLWGIRGSLLGRKMDIVGMAGQNDGYKAMRHPRFKCWRPDLEE